MRCRRAGTYFSEPNYLSRECKPSKGGCGWKGNRGDCSGYEAIRKFQRSENEVLDLCPICKKLTDDILTLPVNSKWYGYNSKNNSYHEAPENKTIAISENTDADAVRNEAESYEVAEPQDKPGVAPTEECPAARPVSEEPEADEAEPEAEVEHSMTYSFGNGAQDEYPDIAHDEPQEAPEENPVNDRRRLQELTGHRRISRLLREESRASGRPARS